MAETYEPKAPIKPNDNFHIFTPVLQK